MDIGLASPVSKLPKDLLDDILSRLDTLESRLAAQGVCRSWMSNLRSCRNLSFDPKRCRIHNMFSCECIQKALCKLLSASQGVETLLLKKERLYFRQVIQLKEWVRCNQRTLESVTLDTTVLSILSELSRCPQLTRLELIAASFHGRYFTNCSIFNKLTTLHLENGLLDDSDLQQLLELCGGTLENLELCDLDSLRHPKVNLPGLVYLKVSQANFSFDGFSNLNKLKTLRLECLDIGDSSLEKLLGQCGGTLENLELCACHNLKHPKVNLPKLVYLHICHMDLGFTNSLVFSKLSNLYLEGISIGESMLEKLLELCGGTLENLKLRDCEVLKDPKVSLPKLAHLHLLHVELGCLILKAPSLITLHLGVRSWRRSSQAPCKWKSLGIESHKSQTLYVRFSLERFLICKDWSSSMFI